tara:strand:- start:491 stop:937 length:447 start_codon:yes stop_codon:yes gene_type:complete
MKALIQRVKSAAVSVNNVKVGSISAGLLVFMGVHHSDTHQQVKKCVQKILDLRIFNDENNKMNISCRDLQHDILLVSQFTLYGNCSKGRRPSYVEAASPELAQRLYNEMINEFEREYKPIQTGRFQAHMEIDLINDGPVTLMLEEYSS